MMLSSAAAIFCLCAVAVYSFGVCLFLSNVSLPAPIPVYLTIPSSIPVTASPAYPRGTSPPVVVYPPCHCSDGEESKKFKRDPVSGLVSFPRIGRYDQFWKLGSRDLKRQSLVSFPRTGKRDQTQVPLQPPDVLWLGPEPEETWALVQLKDILISPRAGKRFRGELRDDTG